MATLALNPKRKPSPGRRWRLRAALDRACARHAGAEERARAVATLGRLRSKSGRRRGAAGRREERRATLAVDDDDGAGRGDPDAVGRSAQEPAVQQPARISDDDEVRPPRGRDLRDVLMHGQRECDDGLVGHRGSSAQGFLHEGFEVSELDRFLIVRVHRPGPGRPNADGDQSQDEELPSEAGGQPGGELERPLANGRVAHDDQDLRPDGGYDRRGSSMPAGEYGERHVDSKSTIDATLGGMRKLALLLVDRKEICRMQECPLQTATRRLYSIPHRLRLRHSVVELMPSRAAASSRVAESASTRSM